VSDNLLQGGELKNLLKYDQLKTIKCGANHIKEFADVEVLVIDTLLIALIETSSEHY